jgi:hypothetical protein
MSADQKAKVYSEEICSHIGKEPFIMPVEMLKYALKMAFENGYRDGEIDMMCSFHGIVNKENKDEQIRID